MPIRKFDITGKPIDQVLITAATDFAAEADGALADAEESFIRHGASDDDLAAGLAYNNAELPTERAKFLRELRDWLLECDGAALQ